MSARRQRRRPQDRRASADCAPISSPKGRVRRQRLRCAAYVTVVESTDLGQGNDASPLGWLCGPARRAAPARRECGRGPSAGRLPEAYSSAACERMLAMRLKAAAVASNCARLFSRAVCSATSRFSSAPPARARRCAARPGSSRAGRDRAAAPPAGPAKSRQTRGGRLHQGGRIWVIRPNDL